MKLFIITPVAYSFWNYPTQSLLIAILLVFIADIIKQTMFRSVEEETALNQSYKDIKELFKEADEITSKDIYLEDIKIKCVRVDLNTWSYKEIQSLSKSLGISGRNRKRVLLEKEIVNFCN